MPAQRSLPAQPNLRYFKLEARRRLRAGEFTALHEAQRAVAAEHGLPDWPSFCRLIDTRRGAESRVLPQIRWVISRFRYAGEPEWAAPGEDELRQHFSDEFLAEFPAPELVAIITGSGVDLRKELVVTGQLPLRAQLRIDNTEVYACVEAAPPHRISGLFAYPVGERITDSRIARPAAGRHRGVPGAVAGILEEAAADLGLAGLVLAGQADGTPVWTAATGWADLDRRARMTADRTFPVHSISTLITAVAVLRLVADGLISLDDRANSQLRAVTLADDTVTIRELLAHTGGVADPRERTAGNAPGLAELCDPVLACGQGRGRFRFSAGGYAALGQLIADITGLSYADAATRLVLDPLGMTASSFPATAADIAAAAVTGYQVNADGGLTPAPMSLRSTPAVGGLWTTAADLVRFGSGWSSLLPGALASEALRPHARIPDTQGTSGLGWLMTHDGSRAEIDGLGPGTASSLLVHHAGNQAQVALTNRAVCIEPVNKHLLHMMLTAELAHSALLTESETCAITCVMTIVMKGRAALLGAGAAALALTAAIVPTAWSAATTQTPAVRTAGAPASAISPVRDCATLTALDLTGLPGAPSRVLTAAPVTAGGISYCDVRGYTSPQTLFEVKLPVATWQGQYVQQGCGGLCGDVPTEGNNPVPQAADGCAAVTNGELVTASDNEGHIGASRFDGLWGKDDPQLRTVYGITSEHSLLIVAKAVIGAYYGRQPSYSYFDGCSDGGREGLIEAQRYPADFNGILAGAPALDSTDFGGEMETWIYRSNTDATGRQILGVDKLPALHAAVLAACAGADGLIDDPRTCTFDPAAIQCPSGTDTAACLTPAQVDVARKFYSGPLDPAGHSLYPGGGLARGSELAWAGWDISPTGNALSTVAAQAALNDLKYLAFDRNPPDSFTLGDFQFTQAERAQLARSAPLYNSTDPDLNAFRRHGGKIIIYHGWADQAIPTFGTVLYYHALAAQTRDSASFSRLYLIPAQYHCLAGGDPSIHADLLTPLMTWVQAGQAPAALTFPTIAPKPGQPASITVAPFDPATNA
jgi:feruloyl esterase